MKEATGCEEQAHKLEVRRTEAYASWASVCSLEDSWHMSAFVWERLPALPSVVTQNVNSTTFVKVMCKRQSSLVSGFPEFLGTRIWISTKKYLVSQFSTFPRKVYVLSCVQGGLAYWLLQKLVSAVSREKLSKLHAAQPTGPAQELFRKGMAGSVLQTEDQIIDNGSIIRQILC